MSKNIYAYYESIALSDQNEEFSCANYWKASWTARGWNPIMLNKSHAQASNLYGKLQQKLVSMTLGAPSEVISRIPWITSRFTRWCALHAAGGGWMSDYDVSNLSFTPEEADKEIGSNTLSVNKGSAYIIYATKEHAENAIKKMISSDLLHGTEVISEASILGIKETLNAGKSLKHTKSTKDLSRSKAMEKLITK